MSQILKMFLKILIIQTILTLNVNGQQRPDTTYQINIHHSTYAKGKGPVILIDEAHNNLHTKDGGFSAFRKLLNLDGYIVGGLSQQITKTELLGNCKILVIANALNAFNIRNWVLPTPSAFTQDEIAVLKQWVKNGGNLLLIADHMPYAGAANDLAKAFGFEFLNGFAKTGSNFFPPSVFSFENKGLEKSFVTIGNYEYESIDSITTFAGSAFLIPSSATPVICFSSEHISLQSDTAWHFGENTPSKHLDGYYQGALQNFGKGKIAVFGEAAMFTAQIVNEKFKVGFNSEYAPQNVQFILNLIHWLDGVK